MHRMANTLPTSHRAAVRRPVGKRVWMSVLLVCSLTLQVLVPSAGMASDAEWIEICADGQAVRVQADLIDGDIDGSIPCPECDDCLLCAMPVPVPAGAAGIDPADHASCLRLRAPVPFIHAASRVHDWPQPRGPPPAREHTKEEGAAL